MMRRIGVANQEGSAMKYSEFKRRLQRQGVTFEPGKGSHKTLRLNGKRSTFPDHGAKEMPEPLRKAILRDLGL
jgi:mRNA interferase HicA